MSGCDYLHSGRKMVENTRGDPTEVASTDGETGSAVEITDITGRAARVIHPVDGTIDSQPTAERRHDHAPAPELPVSACEVLVAIPAYNESSAIGDIVRRAREHADHVLVVDDGSDDDTVDRATEAGAIVHEHERNRGYGAALKTVFGAARRLDATHLVILDGDGQHDPADVPRLVEAQRTTDANLVIGSRFVGETKSDVPRYRRVGLRTINALTNLSMGVVRAGSRVSDTQSGFRTYDREAIATLAADGTIGDRMSASTDILYHAHHHDYRIEEISITISYDVENASTHAPVTHGVALVRNILKTIERERPLTALAVPGFSFTFGGVGVGYWATTTYMRSGTFPFGLVLVAVFLTLVGVFACFTAIVLHSLGTYFETTGRGGPMR